MSSLLSVFNYHSGALPKVAALLIALSSITGGILLPQPFYFFSLALCGLLILIRGGVKFYNALILFFIAICAFSLVINNPPSFFRAWERFGVYVLVLLVVSPLLISSFATRLRVNLLFSFIQIGIILSIGSFFAYFLGINLFVRLDQQLEIGAGTFSGLMNHSMALGPVAGISGFILFTSLLDRNTPSNARSRTPVRVFMTLCCMGACLLAASRVAVLATGVACLAAMLRHYKDNIAKMMRVLVVLVGILIASFPIWGGVTDFLIQKQKGNEAEGSIIYSRERKFTARVLEFKSSPIYGIGYNVVIPEYDGVVMSNGQIEPGSSWLAVASMTGILGLMVFIPICVRGVRRAWKIISPHNSSILLGLIFFFIVHMIAEGYIFAPKSFLSLLFWLIIAAIDGVYEMERTKCESIQLLDF